MKILIDAFGGDNAPEEIIAGTVEAVNENKNFIACLVGDKDKISAELKKYVFEKERIEIVHASEVITCEEEPTVAIRKKPDSSICVAFKMLKDDEDVKAFVSAGSTGAVLVGATLKLGRLEGVNRPALCPIVPTVKPDKGVYLMDSGANADCKPVNLCQFAIMGSAYAKAMGIENPKVALLSNGTEDEKGNMLNHETFPMLKALKSINFVGNIEARDILSGDVDVVVADGFSGNIALKSMEGTVNTIFTALKEEIYSSVKGKIGGLLLKKSFKNLKNRLDYNKKGGALFLGVKKTVLKTHGSAKRLAVKNTVLQAVRYSESNISEQLQNAILEEPIPVESAK